MKVEWWSDLNELAFAMQVDVTPSGHVADFNDFGRTIWGLTQTVTPETRWFIIEINGATHCLDPNVWKFLDEDITRTMKMDSPRDRSFDLANCNPSLKEQSPFQLTIKSSGFFYIQTIAGREFMEEVYRVRQLTPNFEPEDETLVHFVDVLSDGTLVGLGGHHDQVAFSSFLTSAGISMPNVAREYGFVDEAGKWFTRENSQDWRHISAAEVPIRKLPESASDAVVEHPTRPIRSDKVQN